MVDRDERRECKVRNEVTYMSTVEQGEGLATVEDITVICLGIWLEVDDTSG